MKRYTGVGSGGGGGGGWGGWGVGCGGAMVCLCPPNFLPHILIFHLNYMFI